MYIIAYAKVRNIICVADFCAFQPIYKMMKNVAVLGIIEYLCIYIFIYCNK